MSMTSTEGRMSSTTRIPKAEITGPYGYLLKRFSRKLLGSAFLPLNTPFLDAVTRWQVRPTPWDRMALNDHSDWRWDERVLDALASLSRRLRPLEEQLSAR
jgi:hypothetical protein